MTPRPVRIVWHDHFDLGAGAWVQLGDVRRKRDLRPAKIETVGWLVDETADTVAVTHTVHAEANAARGLFVILRSTIVSMEEL